MSIPKYNDLMLPLLRLLADGKEHSLRECIEALASEFQLSDKERAQLHEKSQQPVFDNRVSWARTYLKHAGLLESPRRGFVRITQRGQEALEQGPDRIDNDFLMQYPEFLDFITRRRERRPEPGTSAHGSSEDPVQRVEEAFEEIEETLVEELLEQVRGVSPGFFERLVVRLLVKMGYGGGLSEAAKVVGGSGDEGIDGVINEDRLGLDVIYIQAKQWANPVGRPEVQKFVGALHGKRAKKGVFITSSSFSKEARDYIEHLEPRVVLLDGEAMARLMIRYNVGVSTKAVYELKDVDHDFFED